MLQGIARAEKLKILLKKYAVTRYLYFKMKHLLVHWGFKKAAGLGGGEQADIKEKGYKLLKKIMHKSILLTRFYNIYWLKWMHQLGIIKDKTKDNGVTVEQSLQEMKNSPELKETSNILVAGRLCFTNRISFLNQIAKQIPDHKFIILVENGEKITNYHNIYNYQHYKDMSVDEIRRMKYFIVPGIFVVLRNRYPRYKNMKVTRTMRSLIAQKEYLCLAAQNLRRRHYDLGTGYPEAWACRADEYINEMLDELNPKMVIIWNQFHAFHYILDQICKERGIKTMYFEYGVLPGTYTVEAGGQMGESYPSRQYEEFRDLEVLPDETEEARKIWDYLYLSKLNRKPQPQNNRREELMARLKPGRPIILYAGQNDYESGLYPYTEHTRINHSPIFKSSDDAAIFLAELAARNDWNFIYKWHPIMLTYELPAKYPANLIKIDDIDINEIIDLADLTITILSQTAYVATIRKKPALILGYMQLRGKGCIYQAFVKEDIEAVIKKALENGFTNKQSDAFVKHLAQLNKYYLYDDREDREIRYGKSINQCSEYIAGQLNANTPANTRMQKIIDEILSANTKVVSFDLFDTLLVRPVMNPTDLFKLVGLRTGYYEDFTQMRIAAEKSAGMKRDASRDAVTFAEIYHELGLLFHVPPDILANLQQEELAVEMQYLRPRKSVKNLFDTALAAGKRIIITSDMYLPLVFLEKVLNAKGFSGYERLYLSSAEQKSKKTGRLYQKIVNDFAGEGIKSDEILHIGDSKEVDIDNARRYGLRTVFFQKATDAFKESKNFEPLYDRIENTLDNTFLIGFIAQNLFDDPFVNYNKNTIFNGQWENLGTVVLGPLLTVFTNWLMEDSIAEKVDTIYFLHRDGYIPKLLYDYMSQYYPESPDSAEMYLNRSMMYSFAASGTNSLFHSINKYPVSSNMTIESFINHRLLVSDENERNEIYNILEDWGYKKGTQKIRNMPANIELLNLLEPYFIKNSRVRTNTVKEYCEALLNPYKRAAVFDVGYRGRAGKFLKDELGLACLEYHICARPELHKVNLQGYRVKSLIHAGMDVIKETRIIYILLDDALSIQEPGAAYIEKQDDGFVPVMETEYVYSPEIAKLQESIIAFGNDFIDCFRDDLRLLYFDAFPLFDLLKKYLLVPSLKDAVMINALRCPDEPSFMDTGSRSNYLDWYELRLKSRRPGKEPQDILQAYFKSDLKFKRLRIILEMLHLLPYAKAIYHKAPDKEFLKKSLKKLHLFNVTNRVYTRVKTRDSKNRNSNREPDYILQAEREIAGSLARIAENKSLLSGNNIMVLGYMVGFDKGVCNYLNQMANQMPGNRLILFSEATKHSEEKTASKISFPFYIVPKLFDKNQPPPAQEIILTPEIEKAVADKDYLIWAVANLKERNPNVTRGHQEVQAYYTQLYFSRVLELLKPKCLVIWNAFEALHHIVDGVAKVKNIPVLYMEFGSLPGTFALESSGQMGESYPARHFEEFKALEVSPAELKNAAMVWNFLRESRLNRNIQSSGPGLDEIRKNLKPNRPIIFYAGQNDFESGLYPYTEHTEQFHSPAFRSSDEAAQFLAALAVKHDWNLIYKPHPLMVRIGKVEQVPPGVHLVEDGDINDLIDLADLTVTILSQTGYISMIRRKPTLMLGYTQLKGKGCTYEAFAREKVEGVVRDALANGLTAPMRQNFQKHIAQMLKYYLYDDLLERDIPYGKQVDDAVDAIGEIITAETCRGDYKTAG